MNYEKIIAYKDGGMGIIKMNNPECENVLDSIALQEMHNVIKQWEHHDGIKLIVITGEGEKTFASGPDINQLLDKRAKDAFIPGLQDICHTIESSSKVTVAALNGYALGAGCELALACDIRIAANHVKIGFPELDLSILPGGGGTQRLARIVGKGRAIDMIFTGEMISAQKAEQIGLVSTIVPLEDLWEVVLEKVNHIVKKGPFALKLAKMVINQGFETDLNTALMLEKLAQSILFNSEDKQEGVNAFLEKRDAYFTGE